MAALPYMQLYVADYLADTLYLDVIESGAYIHLLMNYWQTGKPLPACDKKLARISKCTPEQWSNVRSTVVDYFVEQDGLLYHDRVEADLKKVRAKSKQASDAGKKSAKQRRLKPAVPKASGDSTGVQRTLERTHGVSLNHTDTDTDTDTDKKESKKKKPAELRSPELFEKAYKGMPKRSGPNNRKAAEKAWNGRLTAKVDPNLIVAGVNRYRGYIQKTGKEGTEFVKTAAAFFGPNEHWLDTYDEAGMVDLDFPEMT